MKRRSEARGKFRVQRAYDPWDTAGSIFRIKVFVATVVVLSLAASAAKSFPLGPYCGDMRVLRKVAELTKEQAARNIDGIDDQSLRDSYQLGAKNVSEPIPDAEEHNANFAKVPKFDTVNKPINTENPIELRRLYHEKLHDLYINFDFVRMEKEEAHSDGTEGQVRYCVAMAHTYGYDVYHQYRRNRYLIRYSLSTTYRAQNNLKFDDSVVTIMAEGEPTPE
jgi:hypothetical protein